MQKLPLSVFNFPLTLQAPPRVTGVSLSKELHKRKPSLKVTWTALPLSLVSFYELQYGIKDTSWEHQGSSQPYSQSYFLTKLVPGTQYNVRMRAVSAAGEGEWSDVHTETTYNSEFNPLHVQLCHRGIMRLFKISCLSIYQKCAVNASNVVDLSLFACSLLITS